MSYTDEKLKSIGWDENKIKAGRRICKKCGKQYMQHTYSENFCPLPKKGIIQNYSQSQKFEWVGK
jgi:hypothetical protein